MFSAAFIRVLPLVLLLSACAAAPVAETDTTWVPDAQWWADAGVSGGTFRSADGSTRFVEALHAKNLYEVNLKIHEESGIAARLALTDDPSLNAFATELGGVRQIALTLNLLAAIGDDRDALATSIGHEVAHLYYAHAATRRVRNQPIIATTDSVSGIIAVNTSFSRYEEREADIKGMQWAVAAGFSPCGAARTMRVLRAHAGTGHGDPFISTHPGPQERIARANEMSRKLNGHWC